MFPRIPRHASSWHLPTLQQRLLPGGLHISSGDVSAAEPSIRTSILLIDSADRLTALRKYFKHDIRGTGNSLSLSCRSDAKPGTILYFHDWATGQTYLLRQPLSPRFRNRSEWLLL